MNIKLFFKYFNNISIIIGVLAFVCLTNTTSNFLYIYKGLFEVQLFMNEESINTPYSWPLWTSIVGLFFVYLAVFNILSKISTKFIDKNASSFAKIICLLSILFVSYYATIYAGVAHFSFGLFNEERIKGNIPILINNNTSDHFIVAKNGLILKQNSYFNEIAGEELDFAEHQFMAMLDGTMLSYLNVSKSTGLKDLATEDKVWLYKIYYENLNKLYKELMSNENFKKSTLNSIYQDAIKAEENIYKNITVENYSNFREKCVDKNVGSFFCYNYKLELEDRNYPFKLSIDRMKQLENKYKNKPKNMVVKETIATPKEIYDFLKK